MQIGQFGEVLDLSREESIQILEKTKEILGPNGEHWTKSCWVAEVRGYGGDDEYVYDLEWHQVNDVADKSKLKYCVMGAVEQAAYTLGLIQNRSSSDRFALPISLENLVRSREEWAAWNVVDVNDNPATTFETIRELLDTRLAQLKEEA